MRWQRQFFGWAMTVVWLGLFVAAGAQGKVNPDDPSTVPRVSQEIFKAMHDRSGALVVDVRNADIFKMGHIPGAISVPVADLEQRAATVKSKAKKRPIILYCSCAGEHLSIEGALTLAKSGVTNVHALVGGFPAWVLAGNRVER